MLSSSKCPVKRFTSLRSLLCTCVNWLAWRVSSSISSISGLGGLHGLRVFGTEYILMRFIPVVCRNLAVSLQVLLQFPLHFFLPLLPILCSEGLFFLVGRMFPLSAFPVPIEQTFCSSCSRCHPGIRSIKSVCLLVFDDQCRILLNERKPLFPVGPVGWQCLGRRSVSALRVKLFLHIWYWRSNCSSSYSILLIMAISFVPFYLRLVIFLSLTVPSRPAFSLLALSHAAVISSRRFHRFFSTI